MIGVDVDLEAVGVCALIATGQTRHDRIGMRVVQPCADVQRRVVVRDVDDGTLRWHRPLRRVTLGKARDPFRCPPERFIERAVDADGLAAGEPNRAQLLRRGRWRIDRNKRRMTSRPVAAREPSPFLLCPTPGAGV